MRDREASTGKLATGNFATGKFAAEGITRRRVLVSAAVAGGGLLVGLPMIAHAAGADHPFAASARQGEHVFNPWIKISAAGDVTIAVPRVEMGQGVYTSLPLLAAEELDADWARVHFVQAPVDNVYANVTLFMEAIRFRPEGEGILADAVRWATQKVARALGIQGTGGSTSIREAYDPMRRVGAATREMLIAAAARRWEVPRAECRAEKGTVTHGATGRRLGFGELAADAVLTDPPEHVRLKEPAEWQLIGSDVPRLDLREKTDGQAIFAPDIQGDGMVYGAVRTAPRFGAKLKSFDKSAIAAKPGFIDVVEIPRGIAVVADNTWRASQLLAALPVIWDDTGALEMSSDEIFGSHDRAIASGDAHVFTDRGDAPDQLAGAGTANVFSATYRLPYLAHACMEPMNATALYADGTLTLWTGNQNPNLMRNAAADEIDIDADRVTVETPFLGGGFGRRSEPDAARQAARVAKALAGRPVKLFWDREEDMRHDTYRPAGTCRMTARLDGDGRPVAWHHRSAGQSVLADYMSRIRPGAPLPTADATQVEGAEDIAYAIPHIRVEHVTTEPLVPVGWWRSVGNSLNAFFVESFIDELAHNAGADPYEYRRALLADRPRDRAVLDLVAKKSGWGDKPPPGRGRGLAVHKSYESYVAQVVEISVTDGEIRLHKVTCAVDCGTVVHPDTVVAQMESAVTFGATAALFGRITIDQGRVVEGNFPDYDMIRMETMPEIDVHLAPTGGDPGGIGEAGTPAIAPAIANAVFALTGKRVRELPFAIADI